MTVEDFISELFSRVDDQAIDRYPQGDLSTSPN